MEADLRMVLDAWRKLLVENDRLRQENLWLKTLVFRSVPLDSLPVSFRERGKRIKENDRE